MKLYRVKIPAIATAVVERLNASEMLEVLPENKGEAELDLCLDRRHPHAWASCLSV